METIAKKMNIKTVEDYTRFYNRTKEYCDAIDKKIAELEAEGNIRFEKCKENLNDMDVFVNYEVVNVAISGLRDNKIRMLDILEVVKEDVEE